MGAYKIEKNDVEATRCPLCDGVPCVDIAAVQTTSGIEFLVTTMCQRCQLVFRRVRPSLSWFKRAWGQRARQQQPICTLPESSVAVRSVEW